MRRRAEPRISASIAAAVLAASAWAPLAGAHAVLVRSSPPARGSIREPPDRVELWFNERLEPAYSRMSVHDVRDQQVDRGDARVGPEDTRRLSVMLLRLAPGRYTVRYRVVSVDGHVIDSSFTFTVRDRTGGAPRD